MSLLSPDVKAGSDPGEAFEAMILRQLLKSSGAFSGGEGSLHADLFVDALADAVTSAGGIGLRESLPALGTGQEPPPPLQGASALRVGPSAGSRRPAHAAPAAPAGLLAGASHLSSAFGTRSDPFTGAAARHTGVDLAARAGTPILAAADGVVLRAGPRGGYGQALEVGHADGTTTLYAHASELLVGPGDRVERGQAIAKVGATGRATGPHLHFEVRRDDRPVDPTRALKAYADRVDGAGEGSLR